MVIREQLENPMTTIRELRERVNVHLFDKWELGAPKTQRLVSKYIPEC